MQPPGYNICMCVPADPVYTFPLLSEILFISFFQEDLGTHTRKSERKVEIYLFCFFMLILEFEG